MTGLFRKSEEFTADERLALLNQFEKSGLTQQEFAREHNINEATFRNWVWIKAKPNFNQKRYSPTERKKIVEACLASGMTVSSFAHTWGVGVSTLHTWVLRYQEEGVDGLISRSRKAGDKRLGMKVPVAVQDEIIAIKKQEPSFGFRKIKNWMFRSRGIKVSTGSIRKTVKREGLPLAIKPRKKRRSSERVRRFERARPMQLWQSDITQYTLGPASMRVYLTVFMDDHSRYIVGWRLQSRQTSDLVMDAFKDAMVRFGKPEEVLTDQGRQYFAWRGKSDLEKFLEKEGIKHVVSRAHHPQTLGKCERFWETVGNEFWTRAKPQDLDEARERLKYFIDYYNHQRPHQGLDGMTPADRFFGVAEDVREIIEKTVVENSLRLAVGELPKAPAFLIGQIGDQQIAFHGSGGKFILSNENLIGGQNGKYSSNKVSVSEYAIDRNAAKEAWAPTGTTERGASPAHELSADTGAGNLGCGERGRAWTSEANGCENNGDMVRNEEQDRCDKRVEFTPDPILANEQSGHGWNACGSTDSTSQSPQAKGEWNDRTRRDQHVTEDGERA